MDIPEPGGASAPSPSFFEMFSQPRGGSRRRPMSIPMEVTPLPLLDWLNQQPDLPPSNGTSAESHALDLGGKHAIRN